MTDRIKASHALIDQALEKYKSLAVYGLFSGGHDSLTATHIAAQHPSFSGAVHINTGIGVPETREFVQETCKRFGWPLRIIRAKEDCGQDYRQIVLEHGFPGPAMHFRMYQRLKERAVRMLIRETKAGHSRRDTVILVSGVRSQESERRMGYVEPIQKDASRIWVAVIHDWSKSDCNHYIADKGIPRNPVVDKIHKSGECLCGAYAKPGELDELEFWYPETAKEIRDIQEAAKRAGVHHQWGVRPPGRCKTRKTTHGAGASLCYSCDKLEESK